MAKTNKKNQIKTIRLYYDNAGNALSVWFDDPEKEYISEESGDEVILNKYRQGRVIGFEKLNYLLKKAAPIKKLPVEAMLS